MSWLQTLILSVIRGLAGILPLSESAMLTIARDLLGLPLDGSGDDFLGGFCLMAVVIAIAIVYRRELLDCVFRSGGKHPSEREKLGRRQWMLLVSSFFFSIPGLIFGWNISFASNIFAVAILSVVNGFILFAGDRISRGSKELTSATLGDGVVTGLAQSASVIPGFSRTGITMTAGLIRGLDPAYCLKFSLLSAVPYFFIRALILIFSGSGAEIGVAQILGGMLLSGAASYLSIRLIRFSVRRGTAGYFTFISWGAGLLLFMLYLIS